MAKKDHGYSYDEIEKFPYAKVTAKGEIRRPYHKKDVWELDVKELFKAVNPLDFFRTTGDAVIKSKALEAELFAAAGVARRIGNVLVKLRGDNVYFETAWIDGRLLVKSKNPRKNKEEKAKALQENFQYGKK